MDVQKYEMPMADFEKMPDNERQCFLMAGHLANEILFLSKLLLIPQTKDEREIVQLAELTQKLFIIRLMAGKIFEGWKSIQQSYYNTKVSLEYKDILDNDVISSLKFLGQYFAKGNNIISSIRNNYAFHYSPEKIMDASKDLVDGRENVIFVAETHLNSLYYISDVLMFRSMIHNLGLESIENGLGILYDEILEVQGHLLKFVQEFLPIQLTHVRQMFFFE